MSTIQLKNREDGFTLLELLLVIGVAALLLIGGIVTYRLVSDGNKSTEFTRLLLTIRQELQVLAQQSGGVYTGIEFASNTDSSTTPLVVGGVLRNNQRNAFNGDILIEPTDNTATDDALQVTYQNISQSGCTKLGVAINNPSEVVSISVNGAALTVPTTAAAVAAECTETSNEIVWIFP